MGGIFTWSIVLLTICCIAAFVACIGVALNAHHAAQSQPTISERMQQLQTQRAGIQPRGIVSPSNSELLHNTIAFGVPSVVFFSMRIINSAWVLRKFRLEDYLMCVTFFFYCSLLTFINVSARYNTNLFPPEEKSAILANPADVHNRIIGSILVIPLEQSMLLSTWGVKTCVWLFLRRLCRQLPKFQLALSILIWYIWIGYWTIQVVYYGIVCKPFQQYWAVPVTNSQCATYSHYSIVQMVFNITSDIGLIVIPIIMFSIARLPLKRKLVLIGVFSMAIFTILAAILNKYFNFKSPMTTTYQLWYIREASVAIQVGNIICCWQLFQKVFKIRSFDNKSAQIITDPEMARRAHLEHPSVFSKGGSPKTDSWFARQRARMEYIGEWTRRTQNFLSIASRSYASQPSRSGRSGMTGSTYFNEKRAGENHAAPVTPNKNDDDSRHAITYSNQEDIV